MRSQSRQRVPWSVGHKSAARTTVTRPSAAAPVSADQIAELLARWQSSGLVTAEQAQRIAAAESFAPASGPPRLRPPGGAMVGEALGYAGAVLIVAAVMVLMGRFWFDLNLGVRVIITGGAAAETWLLGRLATARFGRPGRRLCGVLCTVSVGMFGATAALVAADGLHWADNNVAVFAGALAAGYAIGLWRRAESVPLHAATFAAVAVSIGAAADHLEALHDQAAPLGI